MANETPEVKEDAGRKYITGTFDVKADEAFLRTYDLVKNVGGASNQEIIKLGVEAYKKTKEYQKRVAELRSTL